MSKLACVLGIAGLAGLLLSACGPNGGSKPARIALYDELKPVGLKNCDLKRYGSPNDGGYLMCANLLKGVESIYSYGIDIEDNWGCQMSKEFNLPTHEYDCFTKFRPTCDGGKLVYHDECIGPKTETKEGKAFDSLAEQFKKNGDGEKKHIVVKIDVEGAEWDSLMQASDDTLDRIDTLVGEFHGVGEQRFVDGIKKLKTKFWMLSVHFNNYGCNRNFDPLPARAYQILWINKRIGQMDPSIPGHVGGTPPDAPDAPHGTDCQMTPH
jgi:hypothetical protein